MALDPELRVILKHLTHILHDKGAFWNELAGCEAPSLVLCFDGIGESVLE